MLPKRGPQLVAANLCIGRSARSSCRWRRRRGDRGAISAACGTYRRRGCSRSINGARAAHRPGGCRRDNQSGSRRKLNALSSQDLRGSLGLRFADPLRFHPEASSPNPVPRRLEKRPRRDRPARTCSRRCPAPDRLIAGGVRGQRTFMEMDAPRPAVHTHARYSRHPVGEKRRSASARMPAAIRPGLAEWLHESSGVSWPLQRSAPSSTIQAPRQVCIATTGVPHIIASTCRVQRLGRLERIERARGRPARPSGPFRRRGQGILDLVAITTSGAIAPSYIIARVQPGAAEDPSLAPRLSP